MTPELRVSSGASAVEPRSHLRGLVEVGVASVLWGTGGLAVQLIREQEALSPVTISAWRMAIAAAVLLVALVVLRRVGELVTLARHRPRSCSRWGSGRRPTRASTSSRSPRSASRSRRWSASAWRPCC